MSENQNSAWSPSSREIERRQSRRAISRKQAGIAAASSIFVLGTLALILVTSPGWETVKSTFFDVEYGKEVFPTVIKGLWINLQLTFIAGAVTAIPLLLFNGSTNRLPFTTIGLLQYITPTLQFSIGVWVLNEDMPTARWIGFLIIWAALVTLAIDLIRSSRTVNNSVA